MSDDLSDDLGNDLGEIIAFHAPNAVDAAREFARMNDLSNTVDYLEPFDANGVHAIYVHLASGFVAYESDPNTFVVEFENQIYTCDDEDDLLGRLRTLGKEFAS